MRVKEWQGEVVFLHEVVPGAADRSYGIQVAKLAGLPRAVIERARTCWPSSKPRTAPSPQGFDDLPLLPRRRAAAATARKTTRSTR